MEWLDAHAGGVQAIATFALILLTGYYAWFTRALVRETRSTLQANARLTLQARLDRVAELFISNPELTKSFDEPDNGKEDARFYLAGVLVGVLEEAYTQFAVERSMPEEDWQAWATTTDRLMKRPYLVGYWSRLRDTYSGPFRNYLDGRLARPGLGLEH